MRIAALIVEQLDEDGLLKTFRTKPTPNHELIVAFPNEYDEPRKGPFHFLDPEDEERFAKGFANCAIRKVAASRFFHQGDFMVFTTMCVAAPSSLGQTSRLLQVQLGLEKSSPR